MKVTFNRAKLAEAFASVAAVAPKNSPKPVLQNVKVSADQNGQTVTLCATDLELGIRVNVPNVEVDESGTLLVPTERFFAILRSSNDDTIRLETGAKNATIRGKSSKFSLPTEDPQDFPPVNPVAPPACFELPKALLAAMINRTGFACDEKSVRYALGGVKFEYQPKTGNLLAIGCDGRRLAKMEGPADAIGGAALGDVAIVPIRSLKAAARVLTGEGTVRVGIVNNDFVITTDEASVSSRMLEGRYPRWQEVLPKRQNTNVFDVTVGPFEQALRQAAIVTSEESKGVDFEFGDGSIKMHATTADVGDSDVDMPMFTQDGVKVGVTLDPTFVLDFLKVLDDDQTFRMDVFDGNAAVLFTVDEGYDYVAMPLARQC